jgi:hypothetical protein
MSNTPFNSEGYKQVRAQGYASHMLAAGRTTEEVKTAYRRRNKLRTQIQKKLTKG